MFHMTGSIFSRAFLHVICGGIVTGFQSFESCPFCFIWEFHLTSNYIWKFKANIKKTIILNIQELLETVSGQRTHVSQECALVRLSAWFSCIFLNSHQGCMTWWLFNFFKVKERKTGTVLQLNKYFSITLWKTGDI